MTVDEGGHRPYAEVLASKYAGKTVEILFASDWGVRLYAEYNVNNKPVIIGQIVGAEGDCLDISVFINSKDTQVYKVISINAWIILSVSEYEGNSHVLAFTKQVLGKQ